MFDIQISNPVALEVRDENDDDLNDAIQTIFPLENEYCIIIWNYIFIPVSYKYDISFMINDIIKILNFTKNEEGTLEIHWASNTFASIWKIECASDLIKIDSKWNSVGGVIENLLNENSFVEVEKQFFVERWTALLLFVKGKLEKAGYNENNLVDFYQLESIHYGPDLTNLYQ